MWFRKLQVETIARAAFRTVRQDSRRTLQSVSPEVSAAEPPSPVVQTETPSVSLRLSTELILELPSDLRSVNNNSGHSGLIANLMPLTVPPVVQMENGAYWNVPDGGPNAMRLNVDGIETNFGNFGQVLRDKGSAIFAGESSLAPSSLDR